MILSINETGEIPERSKGADCKSVGSAFEGSNPSLPTNQESRMTKEERIADLREKIRTWDETRLATQGRAGKRRLEFFLKELEKSS